MDKRITRVLLLVTLLLAFVVAQIAYDRSVSSRLDAQTAENVRLKAQIAKMVTLNDCYAPRLFTSTMFSAGIALAAWNGFDIYPIYCPVAIRR